MAKFRIPSKIVPKEQQLDFSENPLEEIARDKVSLKSLWEQTEPITPKQIEALIENQRAARVRYAAYKKVMSERREMNAETARDETTDTDEGDY